MNEVKVVPSVDGADVELVIVVCVAGLVTVVCNDVVFISIDVVVSVFVFVGIVDLSIKKILIGQIFWGERITRERSNIRMFW
jgi:hypothetical protein